MPRDGPTSPFDCGCLLQDPRRELGEGFVPTEYGDEHTEGSNDGHDPRIVDALNSAFGKQTTQRAAHAKGPARQVRSEREGGEREQGVAFQARRSRCASRPTRACPSRRYALPPIADMEGTCLIGRFGARRRHHANTNPLAAAATPWYARATKTTT